MISARRRLCPSAAPFTPQENCVLMTSAVSVRLRGVLSLSLSVGETALCLRLRLLETPLVWDHSARFSFVSLLSRAGDGDGVGGLDAVRDSRDGPRDTRRGESRPCVCERDQIDRVGAEEWALCARERGLPPPYSAAMCVSLSTRISVSSFQYPDLDDGSFERARARVLWLSRPLLIVLETRLTHSQTPTSNPKSRALSCCCALSAGRARGRHRRRAPRHSGLFLRISGK